MQKFQILKSGFFNCNLSIDKNFKLQNMNFKIKIYQLAKIYIFLKMDFWIEIYQLAENFIFLKMDFWIEIYQLAKIIPKLIFLKLLRVILEFKF